MADSDKRIQETDLQVPNSTWHKQWEDKKVSVPKVFYKLLSWVSRWLLQTSGKSKRPYPCDMQVGKSKPQILATCKLGNQNPKSLLHAGWEIKTPNPCYMQAGKFKPQILATRRLGNSNHKSLLQAGWEIKTPNPCYMQAGKFKTQILATCRLENQNPNPCYMQVGKLNFKHLINFKHQTLATCRLRVQNPHILATRGLGNQTPSLKALLHAGREINPQILVSGMLGNQTPNLCYMWVGNFVTPNPCYIQVGRAKSSNHCCKQIGNSDTPPTWPLQIFATWKFRKPNILILAKCRYGNLNTQILAARRLRKHPNPPSNFLLHATWETWGKWLLDNWQWCQEGRCQLKWLTAEW